MVALVRYIVEHLVEDKSAVVVTSRMEGNREVISVQVAEDDMGKVIGKQGRIAMSIRKLVKAVGIRDDKHYTVEIAD